ncbi:MAG: hypothetical protein IH991_15485 [Planctomycetes bacterium]|nr:hypothetical protein [Planctomycetota bacterium]
MQHQKRLPSIAKNSAEIARQNSRVFRMIDQMVYHVDQIVEEAHLENWGNVERMSKVIAEESERKCYSLMRDAASQVSRAAKAPTDEHAVQRGLIKLLGAVGRT